MDEKKKALMKACEKHQVLYKDAMNGMGVDRHLFALYVASRGMGYVSLSLVFILFHFLFLSWNLSLSRQTI